VLEKPGVTIEASESIPVVHSLLSRICTNLIGVINHRVNDSHYQRPETRSQKETPADWDAVLWGIILAGAF